jgi:hypothetical protein
MKKIHIILIILAAIVLLILGLGFYKFNFTNDDIYNADGTKIDSINKLEEIKIGEEKPSQIINGRRCFSRDQIATKDAPYKVHEDIILDIKDGLIIGTKKGTQAGPDMTNGYWGDLSGSLKNNLLELVYSYTVDASKGKELEIYEYKDNILNRMFWPVTEKNHILTPNRIGEPKIIPYIENKCDDVVAPTLLPSPTIPINSIACTKDAKQCPDGSYVGRTGVKCEFICN